MGAADRTDGTAERVARARGLTGRAAKLPGPIDGFLRRALQGPTVAVPGDPTRREMPVSEVVGRLARATTASPGTLGSGERLDYVLDLGPQLRVIVLDLVRRDGGSGGMVSAEQPAWLERQLRAAGDRWVIAVTHQPLASFRGRCASCSSCSTLRRGWWRRFPGTRIATGSSRAAPPPAATG